MNADIPTLHCWVRLPFLSGKDGVEEAYAFGIQSVGGRALGFHCMTKSGAHYRGVPIHAIATHPDTDERTLSECQLWDCFSNRPVVHVYGFLRDHQCICYMRGSSAVGTYLFTVDWLPNSNEDTGLILMPEQNKCAHVIALDDGNVCALPTNRIAWMDAYFIGKSPNPRAAGYKVQTDVYQAEDCESDVSSPHDYMYKVDTDAREDK